MNKQYIISASVPSCPYCSGGVKKIMVPSSIFYKCLECEVCFTVKDQGHAEHELVCEEVKYERTKRI